VQLKVILSTVTVKSLSHAPGVPKSMTLVDKPPGAISTVPLTNK